MENAENYTSLQEFTEEISPSGNKPILFTAQDRQAAHGKKFGVQCVRRQTVAVLITAILVSISANIALGILLYNSSSVTPCTQAKEARQTSAYTLKFNALNKRYTRLCEEYTKLGKTCTQPGVKVLECQPCPESWLRLEDKCYLFSSDKMDWPSSKNSCEAIDGHLAILHSHKQHDVLEFEARKLGGFDYHFWIGLSDREKEGDWRWVDNTPVNKTYWDDASSEPDNHKSGGLHGEDCAVLNAHSQSWFDVPCEFMYKRICEMDVVSLD